jgi:beta-glucosidase
LKRLSLSLEKRAFAYYNVEIKDWHIESGDFEILVGASSKDIKIKETIYVNSTAVIKKKFSRNSTLGDIMLDPNGAKLAESLMKDILGEEVSSDDDLGTDMNTMFKDFVLRSMVTFSGNKFTEEEMESLIEKLNSVEV